MADNNLDDLILTDPEPETKKSKGILALLALVVLLIIVGAVLAKMIFSSPEDSNSTVNTKVANSANTASATEINKDTANNAESNIASNNSTMDSELSPLNDNEMPANVDTVSLDDKDNKDVTSKENNKDSELLTSKSNTVTESVAEHNKKVMAAVSHKVVSNNGNNQEVKVTHKINRPKVAHPKTTKHIYGGVGNTYIQVGSFSKGPEESFINKIRRAGFKYRIKEVNGFRRVLVGPFRNSAEAKRVLSIVKAKISKSAFIKK